MPDTENTNIVDLQVGIGADLKELDADLEIAKKKIAALGNKPIKISIEADANAKEFISKIQSAVAKKPVKVKVESVSTDKSTQSTGGAVKKAQQPTITPKVDISDASGKLDFFEDRVAEIQKVHGNIDVAVKVNTDAAGEITKGVISYTNALGTAQSETYKLVEVFDNAGEVAGREFQFMGEALSESSTKASKFAEDLAGVKNTLDAFASKNADIADQIGLDDLRSKFNALKGDTNAEVVAVQRFKNELGAAKVKVDEIRAAQKAQAAAHKELIQAEAAFERKSQSAEKDIDKISNLQRQVDLQQALKQIRQGDTAEMQRQLDLLVYMEQVAQSDVNKVRSQEQITSIYKQREQIIAAHAAYERTVAQEQIKAAREKVAAERQARAEAQAAAQEQAAHEQAIQQLRTMSMSSYRQEQEKISEVYRKQLDYINRRIDAEQRSNISSKQAVAALQLEKATLRTVTSTARLSVYAKDVAKYINKAKTNMMGFQGYARSTANIFKGIILSQAFYKGLNAVKGVVADAWNLSVALNTAEATFSGMLVGGQEQAKNLLEVLKQEAINTPFDIQNLMDATRLLTAYGIKAENVMFVMHGIEQAVAASGDATKMESISRALGQIYTKGKLMGEEVRQLTEAGIAVSDILTEELGLTQEELEKGWAKLNLDANAAINAIVRGIDKRYGKALENMAKTTRQKINNMRESFTLITSSLTDPLRRAIDSVIDIITPKIEKLYQAIQAVGLGNALRTLLPPTIFDGAVTAINKVVKAAQAIRIVFQQVKPVIESVMRVISWYGHVIFDIFISVTAAIGSFGKAIGDSASGTAVLESGLKRLLGAILAVKTALLVIGAISKIWGVVAILVKGVILVVGALINYIMLLASTMKLAGLAGASGLLPIVGVVLAIIALVTTLAGAFDSVKAAITRVGSALKNLGGGTKIGEMFEDMSGSLQSSIDSYNAEVAKQNEAMSNELKEDSDEEKNKIDDAAGATVKAMEGLMSFDEVYKLNEPSSGGGDALEPIEVLPMPPVEYGGVFDGVGGFDGDLFKDLDLTELQNAIGGLWSEIYPFIDEILIYGLKMLGYFKEMQLYSKLMSGESKEQWTLEKSQTGEDKEQLLLEKQETGEDKEQNLLEKQQTGEDKEQLLLEKQETGEDKEQRLIEKQQTGEDKEQLLLEKQQTGEDKEQYTISRAGGGGGTGVLAGKGTALGLGLLNIAQLGSSVKLISDDIEELRTDGATVSEWLALFVDGLMAAVDVLGLLAAGKLLFGGAGKLPGAIGGATGGLTGGATSSIPTTLDPTAVDSMNTATGKLSPKLSSLAKNLAMGLVIIAEVAAAAFLIVGAIWGLGKLLEQVGLAWEPVIANGDTVLKAMGLGTAVLVAVGGLTYLLGKFGSKLAQDIAIGVLMLLELGVATAVFVAEIWAIGWGLDQIGKAWEPVLENGDTILKAIGLGTALLVAIGVVTALLGVATVASAGALPLAIGLGTAILLELGVAVGLFIAEIWAIGKGLEQLGNAWEPVLEKGDIIASAISLGTDLLIAIGAVAALLGVASIASVGLLPLAIGLGTAMLVELSNAFIKFTGSLADVANELTDNLAPSLERLNEKLPTLASNMSDFVKFMTIFAGHILDYTKSSAVSGLGATIDTIIGWFTKDPLELLAGDVAKIQGQVEKLNAKLELANPELKEAYDLLSDYQRFMAGISDMLGSSSADSLPEQMFVNLKDVGERLVVGFAVGMLASIKTAKDAMETVSEGILKAEQKINGTSGQTSTTYLKEGGLLAQGLASGIDQNAFLPIQSFKTMLNNMLTLMESFTSKVALGLNDMLTNFAGTMSSISSNVNGNVKFTRMDAVTMTRLADGGIIHKAARGVQMLRKPTRLASNVEAGENGAEIVFPLENSSFIKSFASEIAQAVNQASIQGSTERINVQLEQARAGTAQTMTISTASAKEISDAIRSWFTPQMQSLHDVLEQDRTVEVTVPNTSNALWRTVLTELKAVNASSGARGFTVA